MEIFLNTYSDPNSTTLHTVKTIYADNVDLLTLI